MGARLTIACTLALSVAWACGQPFDRQDGQLLIVLQGAPESATHLRAVFVAEDGRRFELERARPEDDIVDDFSAVPVGLGTLSLVLLAERPVLELPDIPVQIEQGAPRTIHPFSEGPRIEVASRSPQGHARASGLIFIDVQDRTPAPPAETVIEVWAAGMAQAPPVYADGGWIIAVDPGLAGDLLPAELEVKVQACFQGLPNVCTTRSTIVRVHREAWQRALNDRPSGPALSLPERGWLVVPDDLGTLWVLDAQTGEVVQPALALGEGFVGAPARVGSLVAVAERSGVVHGLEITDEGLQPVWQASLSAPRPSPVASHAGRLFVADQAQVYEVSPVDGSLSAWGQASAPIVAAPLVLADGVVVVDLLGQVLKLSAPSQSVFRTETGAAIYAPAVAEGDELRVGTSEGVWLSLDAQGQVVGRQDLGAPIVLAPARQPDGWAVAAARSVFFVRAQSVIEVPMGERIMGAPAPWPGSPAGVVLGLFNGRVVRVRAASGPRTLSVLQGLALAPTVLSEPMRVVVGTSAGRLHGLEPETEF